VCGGQPSGLVAHRPAKRFDRVETSTEAWACLQASTEHGGLYRTARGRGCPQASTAACSPTEARSTAGPVLETPPPAEGQTRPCTQQRTGAPRQATCPPSPGTAHACARQAGHVAATAQLTRPAPRAPAAVMSTTPPSMPWYCARPTAAVPNSATVTATQFQGADSLMYWPKQWKITRPSRPTSVPDSTRTWARTEAHSSRVTRNHEAAARAHGRGSGGSAPASGHATLSGCVKRMQKCTCAGGLAW